MKIQYKTGDLLDCAEITILHGVNMQNRMASGVAKVIREKYPEAYDEYMKAANTTGLHLGDVIWAESNDKLIANGVTQEFYGRDNKCYIDYDAINRVMESVHKEALMSGISHIAMPLIGAGLGGGSWKKISKIIEDVFMNVTPVVYMLDGKKPKD